MNGSDESLDGAFGRTDFAFHASGGIERHADADREIVGLREVGDGLGLTVLLNDEVVFGQSFDIPAFLVCHRCDDIDESYVDLQLRIQDRTQQTRSGQSDS